MKVIEYQIQRFDVRIQDYQQKEQLGNHIENIER